MVQGQTVTVGLREKKSWEKNTTEEQRNDPNFKTQYGNQIIEKSKSLGDPPKEEPKVEIQKPDPPSERPQGKNYRIEAMKNKLEKHLEWLKDYKEQMIERYGSEPVYTEMVNKRINVAEDKLKNIETNTSGLPFMPMGKNTHTKERLGFVFNKTTIKVATSSDPNIQMSLNLIQSCWNNLPDDVRDNIKILNIKKSRAGRFATKFQGGKWDNKKGELTLNIHPSSPEVEHDFYHEVGHSRWHSLQKKNPEKVKKFGERVKAIGRAPTKYAESYKRIHAQTVAKYADYERKMKMRGMPITERNKKVMETNLKITEDLYENEIHSELNAYAMGELPDRLIITSEGRTKELLKAYNEMWEIE